MDQSTLLYIALALGGLNLLGGPVTVALLWRWHRRQVQALQDADAAHRAAWDAAHAETRLAIKSAATDQQKVTARQDTLNEKQAVLNEAMDKEIKRLRRGRLQLERKIDTVEENQRRLLETLERLEEGARTRTIIREETAFLRHLGGGTQVNVGEVSATRDAHVGSTITQLDKENPS